MVDESLTDFFASENKSKQNSLSPSQRERVANPMVKRTFDIQNKNKMDVRLRYERFARQVEAQKKAMYADEKLQEVKQLSIQNDSESYSLTEEEKVEEMDILHHVAAETAGVITGAVTYE
jgi:hypothetical protein